MLGKHHDLAQENLAICVPSRQFFYVVKSTKAVLIHERLDLAVYQALVNEIRGVVIGSDMHDRESRARHQVSLFCGSSHAGDTVVRRSVWPSEIGAAEHLLR
jgi:hypothetical protein